ncbi:hypothetical protein [Rhodovarius sp.]|uniref:beta strand repeat-containing protein n=1 Tax=Rhodovarius sp. TaxID=2972673 RepID=UPI00334032B4
MPDTYKIPAQSKLLVMNAYSEQLLKDGSANLALAGGSPTAAMTALSFLDSVTNQATAAIAIANVEAAVHSLTIVPGQNYYLSVGIDTVTGTANNDTIYGISDINTLTQLDTIDGNSGFDTLNVTANTAITSNNVTVKNIEAAVLTTASDIDVDTTAWTGLEALTVTSVAVNNPAHIAAAATTVVNVTNLSNQILRIDGGGGAMFASSDGPVDIGGQPIANAITSATISTPNGGSVNDNSGPAATYGKTLTQVSINGQRGQGTFALTGDAISAVNMANNAGDLTISAAAGTRSLALGLNNVTGGEYYDATTTAVTLTSTGTANTLVRLLPDAAETVTLSGDTPLTLNYTSFSAATDLTVNNSALVTITDYHTTNSLASVTITGSGGFTADLSGQGAQLTKIDASASSGTNTVTINTTEAYLGGSGLDIVTARAAPTATVDGGAGANDIFVLDAPAFSLANVANFESLRLGENATGTYSANGFSHLIEGKLAGNVTWNNVAAGTDLTFVANVGMATFYNLATDTSADLLNITLKSSMSVDAGPVLTSPIETINIALVDTDTTKQVNAITISDAALKSMTITGNAGLTLINPFTTVISSLDASAVTNTQGTAASGLSWTTGALTVASVTKGTSTGGDVINAAAALASVSITAYAGTNTITGSSTIASTLTGGSGNDTINGGSGKDTIIGGGGSDVITAGAGADSITLSGSSSQIVQSAGHSGANTTASGVVSELTGTFDIIRGIAAGDTLKVTGATALRDLTLTASNLAGRDDYASFARGTYDAAAGTFTYAANGADTALTYDTSNVTALYETIILVDYVTASTTTSAIIGSDSVITFA